MIRRAHLPTVAELHRDAEVTSSDVADAQRIANHDAVAGRPMFHATLAPVAEQAGGPVPDGDA